MPRRKNCRFKVKEFYTTHKNFAGPSDEKISIIMSQIKELQKEGLNLKNKESVEQNNKMKKQTARYKRFTRSRVGNFFYFFFSLIISKEWIYIYFFFF